MAIAHVPVSPFSSSGTGTTMGNAPWESWNTVYTATSATTISITASNQIWMAWNLVHTGPGTGWNIVNNQIWPAWNEQYGPELVTVNLVTADPAHHPVSVNADSSAVKVDMDAIRAEQARRIAAQQAEREEYNRARLLANDRAEELLLSMLTEEQAASYKVRGWFEVRGSRGGRWRIRNVGQAGNVDLMPEIGDEAEMSFCCHPPDHLPVADAHLAQMLHLVTDEDGFRATANISYRRQLRPLPVGVHAA